MFLGFLLVFALYLFVEGFMYIADPSLWRLAHGLASEEEKKEFFTA